MRGRRFAAGVHAGGQADSNGDFDKRIPLTSVRQWIALANQHSTETLIVPSNIADRELVGDTYTNPSMDGVIKFLTTRYHLTVCHKVPDAHSITLVEGKCPSSH
jgi:hypothetical protein